MAKKSKQLSITKWEKGLYQDNEVEVELPWDSETTITIKKTLSLEDFLGFVQEIVWMTISDDDGEFTPEGFDFGVKTAMLRQYAGFRIPDNIDKHYDLVYRTPAVDLVLSHIDGEQFEEGIAAARKKIQYMLDMQCSVANARATELMGKVAELISKIDDLADMGAQMYKGMSPDDMAKLVKSLGDMEKLDEHEIVRAVMSEQKAQDGGEKVVPFPEKKE